MEAAHAQWKLGLSLDPEPTGPNEFPLTELV